jgi:sugar (pentulose or hexulose) kinase
VILTVDLGTSFVKVALWNEDGLVAIGRTPLVTTHPAPGQAEQDPATWVPAIVDACPAFEHVDVIAFAAARATMVPIEGDEYGPAILWSDRRIAHLDPQKQWVSMRDFVVRQLTGVLTTDWTIDSVSPTPHAQPRKSTDVIGETRSWKAGTPVVIGAGDRQCEVLGTGATATIPMVSWGTTANVSMPTETEQPVEGLRVTKAAIDGWLLEGGLSAAGSLLAWMGVSLDDAAGSPPGARGVVALPWLGGARAPWWRPDAGAAFVNMSSAHTRADVARAAIEGVAWDIDRCLRRMATPERLVLAGSGSASAAWRDVITGVTGLPATIRRHADAASVGAALLGAAGIGIDLDVEHINPVVAEVRPAGEEIYASLRDRMDRIATTVIEL